MIITKSIVTCWALLILPVNCQEFLNETQEVTQLQKVGVTIYEFRHRILEETIPQILADLVIENVYINTLSFNQALANLNISISNSFIQELLIKPGFDVVFNASKTDLSAFLKLIINQIPNRRENLKTILQLLNIDYEQFMDAYAWSENEILYDLLSTANCSEADLDTVLQLANTSLSEVTHLAQAEIIEPLTNGSFRECVEIFGRSHVADLLNNSLFGAQVSAIADSSLIYEILTNFTDELNMDTIWAVDTTDGILSIPKAHHVWKSQDNYIETYLLNVENHIMVRHIENVSLEYGKPYSVIKTNEDNITTAHRNITKASDYTAIPEDCMFCGKANEQVKIIDATDYYQRELFIYVKYSGLRINIGSPFICNGTLYGMLTKQYDEKLDFLIVGHIDDDNDNDDDDSSDDNSSDDNSNDDDSNEQNGVALQELSMFCLPILLLNMLINNV